MREQLLDIRIVIGIVVAINLLLLLIKTDNKFWMISIPLWGILLLTMIIVTPMHDRYVLNLDKEYWESAEGKSFGDREILKQLKSSQKQNVQIKMTLLHFVGLQTIMTFILQIIGLKKAESKKLYRWTAAVFGLLTGLYLVIQVMIEIVPTGPFV